MEGMVIMEGILDGKAVLSIHGEQVEVLLVTHGNDVRIYLEDPRQLSLYLMPVTHGSNWPGALDNRLAELVGENRTYEVEKITATQYHSSANEHSSKQGGLRGLLQGIFK